MKVATHSGSFHADELFAIAALRVVHGELELVRTRDPDALARCDVRVDVGLRDDPSTGDYDHHQRGGAGERPNGIRFASFGLVWKDVGPRACEGDERVAALVDEVLVQPVDANDNGQTLAAPVIDGVKAMTVSDVLAAFNPRWDEPDDDEAVDARFHEALDVAEGILRREIAGARAAVSADQIVADAVASASDARVVVLEESVPWHRAIHAHAPEALLVVVPKSTGWGLQAVPAVLGRFENRLDLPADWAGLQSEELSALTGVEDARFCHSARFLAVAGTREGALALADLALQEAAS